MVFVPQSISLRAWMMLRRAASLSSGATASSTSRKTMSAADFAAFSNKLVFDPGTASSERCRREWAGSMLVKLMVILRDASSRLPGCAEAGGGAVDRHQEGGADLLAAVGTMCAQQVDLLAAHLVDGFETPRETPPKLWEAFGDRAIARDAQNHLAGQLILRSDAGEDWLAHGGIADKSGIFRGDRQVDLQQRALHVV